jgi:hypothetical protein
MTQHLDPRDITGVRRADLLDRLEGIADQKEALQGKIERLQWCMNLFLLDGFDRDGLEQLKKEVSEFTASCLAWKSEART